MTMNENDKFEDLKGKTITKIEGLEKYSFQTIFTLDNGDRSRTIRTR